MPCRAKQLRLVRGASTLQNCWPIALSRRSAKLFWKGSVGGVVRLEVGLVSEVSFTHFPFNCCEGFFPAAHLKVSDFGVAAHLEVGFYQRVMKSRHCIAFAK